MLNFLGQNAVKFFLFVSLFGVCGLYCDLCPGCAWLNWAVTGRVCQGVGGVSEVGVVRKGRNRESVEGRERRRREGGRKRGNREGRGRQASGVPCFDRSSLVRRSLWRQCSVYVWSLVYAVTITEKKEGRVG